MSRVRVAVPGGLTGGDTKEFGTKVLADEGAPDVAAGCAGPRADGGVQLVVTDAERRPLVAPARAAAAAEVAASGGSPLRRELIACLAVLHSSGASDCNDKRTTTRAGSWPLGKLLVLSAWTPNRVAEKKAKKKRKSKKIDLYGPAFVPWPCWVGQRLCVHAGPARIAGWVEGSKSGTRALWGPLLKLLLSRMCRCDEGGIQEGPKEIENRNVSMEASQFLELPVWEMSQPVEFVSANSFDVKFVWALVWAQNSFYSVPICTPSSFVEVCSGLHLKCKARWMSHYCVTSHLCGGSQGLCAPVLSRHGYTPELGCGSQ